MILGRKRHFPPLNAVTLALDRQSCLRVVFGIIKTNIFNHFTEWSDIVWDSGVKSFSVHPVKA